MSFKGSSKAAIVILGCPVRKLVVVPVSRHQLLLIVARQELAQSLQPVLVDQLRCHMQAIRTIGLDLLLLLLQPGGAVFEQLVGYADAAVIGNTSLVIFSAIMPFQIRLMYPCHRLRRFRKHGICMGLQHHGFELLGRFWHLLLLRRRGGA